MYFVLITTNVMRLLVRRTPQSAMSKNGLKLNRPVQVYNAKKKVNNQQRRLTYYAGLL